MPDTGLQPPYLDPTQYPAYFDAQRKQMAAQMLMGALQQQTQTPESWNSMRVVPKRSLLSNILPLVTALAGKKALDSSNQATAQYMQGLMGGAPQTTSQPSGPPSAPAAPATSAPAGAPVMGSTLSANPSGPQNNMLLTGERRTSQAMLAMMGPQEYGKALAGRYAPTDMEKMLRAAGIDPSSAEGQTALQGAVSKANYIAPIEEREGSIERDARSNAVIGVNPKTDTGVINLYDNQGRYQGQSLAPGAAEAIRGSEQAAQTGKTQGQYNVLPNAGGGSTVIPPGGTPSASAVSSTSSGRQAPKVGQPSTSLAGTPAGWEDMPKLPIGSNLGAPNAFQEGRLKAAGSKDAELSSQYGKEADLADQKLQYNTDARKVIGGAEIGPSSEWLTENRAKLLEWGVPESLVPGSGKVTNTMELNKVLKQSALQGARQIFGSRMTQMEVRLQHEELSPSTSMTKDAILSLMHQDDIKQRYAKQRADDYGKYVQSGGDPLRFESWYAKNFPLTKFAQKQDQTGAPDSKPTFSADEIAAEIKRRGLR